MDENVIGRKYGKLSIRDTVSFLFQHQNLIANKHAIFYRFDDINKRKRVIDSFPVLLGIIDEEYYNLLRQKKDIEREIKLERAFVEKLNKTKDNEEFVLYLSGGGMHNPLLISWLKEFLPNVSFKKCDELGIDGDAKEAVLFAILANENLCGIDTLFENNPSFPSVSFGKISFPI